MKKLTLFILLGLTINAHAALFTVENSSILGAWSSAYHGYYSESAVGSANYWSGYYIGYFTDNDSESLLKDLAEDYLGVNLTYVTFSKVDPVPGSNEVFDSVTGAYYGTWTCESPYELGFYAVKAGSQFALYYVDPSQGSGYWSTIHLQVGMRSNQPEISHLSALAGSTPPVPEPATLMLVGSGLLGLAGFRRKNK